MILTSDDLRSMADALDQYTDTRMNTGVEIDGPAGTTAELAVNGNAVGQLVWSSGSDPVDGRYAIRIERAS